MANAARDAFYGLLRERLAPRLRERGFKGSGRHFRRVRGDIINTINIQGDRHGRSVAVNLGLHLTFLPLAGSGKVPDVSNIRAVDCEFRVRLAPGRKSDYWWKYVGLLSSPTRQVDHLVKTYFDVGEPAFKRFDTLDKFIGMVSLEDVVSGQFVRTFGVVAPARAALTMARIHGHRGNRAQALQYAQAGLDKVGHATALMPAFREFLDLG